MREIDENLSAIKALYPGPFPKVALVLGSGLGPFGDTIDAEAVISYADIPHFPQPTVEGHAGKLIIGSVGGTPVACLQGRMHLYEGHSPQALATPVRTLQRLGVEVLVLTNAAGSLKADMPPGSLMMIEDHINLSGQNPLTGPNDAEFGPRFPDMTEAYDTELRAQIRRSAEATSVTLHEGVYVQVSGPNFETPAEIRMFQVIGASSVGMSTVPEVIVARHCGVRIAAISLITNFAAGLGHAKLTHEHTIEEADKAYENTQALLTHFIGGLAL